MLLDHPVLGRAEIALEFVSAIVAVTVKFPGTPDWTVTGVLRDVTTDVDQVTDGDQGYLVVDPIPGTPGCQTFAIPLCRVTAMDATQPAPQQLHGQAGWWLAQMLVAWAARFAGVRLGDVPAVDRAEGLGIARSLSRVCGWVPGGSGELYEGELVELAEVLVSARCLDAAWSDWHVQREALLARHNPTVEGQGE